MTNSGVASEIKNVADEIRELRKEGITSHVDVEYYSNDTLINVLERIAVALEKLVPNETSSISHEETGQ